MSEGYGLIGLGRIGRRLVGRTAATPQMPPVGVVLVRPDQRDTAAGLVGSARVCCDIDDFIARRPAVAIECASRLVLAEHGPRLLRAGVDLVPLSLTALADPRIEQLLLAAAAEGPGRLEIAPGAIGTLDLLATAREEGLRRVIYRQAKSPQMWRLTPAVGLADLDSVHDRQVFFRGSVREVAQHLPNNLNTSVGVALAGLGLDRTEAELVADPALSQTAHELELFADPGNATLRLAGRDVAPDGDPVDYTTFSLLRLLRRRGARIVV